jgi:hypothetical protein
MAKITNTKPKAIETLPRRNRNGEESPWLSSRLTTALRNKYGVDVDGGQRGADHLVTSGMVAIPDGYTLKCVAMRRFGGALGFVLDNGEGPVRAEKVVIPGLPD